MERNWRKGTGIFGTLFVLLLMIGLVVGPSSSGKSDNAAADTPPPVTAPPVQGPGDVNVNVDPQSVRDIFDGPVAADEVAFGDEASELMASAQQERGSNAHSEKTLTTPKELTDWLNNVGNPKAVPVHKRVVSAITDMCGADDVKVHLQDSQGWLLMVVKPESQIHGTSYMVNGQMQFVQDWRQVGADDAYWVPVCTQGDNQGKAVPNGMVRADCANGHEVPKIRIVRPKTPPAPSVECAVDCVPPTTSTTKPPTTTPPTTKPPTTSTTKPPPTTQPPCKVNCTPPTTKKTASESCQLNPNNAGCPTPPIGNEPQDNSTSGVNTGPTPGAPATAPTPNPTGPVPQPNTPAPANNSDGFNAGSGTGSGTPSGSQGTSTGTQTGSNNTSPPANSGQGGSNTGSVSNPL